VGGDITTVPVGPLARGLVIGPDGHLWIGTQGGITRLELA
jgi:streptogramin lyase